MVMFQVVYTVTFTAFTISGIRLCETHAGMEDGSELRRVRYQVAFVSAPLKPAFNQPDSSHSIVVSYHRHCPRRRLPRICLPISSALLPSNHSIASASLRNQKDLHDSPNLDQRGIHTLISPWNDPWHVMTHIVFGQGEPKIIRGFLSTCFYINNICLDPNMLHFHDTMLEKPYVQNSREKRTHTTTEGSSPR